MTTPVPEGTTPTSVYRYYDSVGLLLYVGITSTGIRRNRQHNSDKEWWQWVVRQQVNHYSSRAAAHAAEVRFIQTFRPPFNKQHNHGHEAIANAYRAARAAGSYRALIEEQKERQRAFDVKYTPKPNPSHTAWRFPGRVQAADWKRGDVTIMGNTETDVTVDKSARPPIVRGDQMIGSVRSVERKGAVVHLNSHVKPGWRVDLVQIEVRADGRIRKVVSPRYSGCVPDQAAG